MEAAASSLEADGHRSCRSAWATNSKRCRCQRPRSSRDIVSVNLARLVEALGLDIVSAEPLTQAFVERGTVWRHSTLGIAERDACMSAATLAAFFDDVDVILTPMLSQRRRRSARFRPIIEDTELHLERMTAFAPLASLANISGFPAITLPFGTRRGRPAAAGAVMAPMGMNPACLLSPRGWRRKARWHHRFPSRGSPHDAPGSRNQASASASATISPTTTFPCRSPRARLSRCSAKTAPARRH